ncbi:hypothetical protein MOK15_09940 [Sphingobium sp. BYY-5]|uniref:sigma factor-like helix-turn-helix DNA-binding protein n=1 Tax=Sphingobium sp. BYY-5 TaxID=2926400 RepID=UPI001FA72CCF|nr:sigma factor-like helix-turn-helix DNA-binding protein [Sphingobium sp. BYY-5]MCI4590414.1 hypothetical protein [Sphingobium sp. BYY-5]
MSASHDIDPRLQAAYCDAVARLPPLTRVVFLLHRVDDCSYRQIAGRLSITIPAVECCMAEALSMIAAALDGDTPRRWRRAPIALAETELRQRHRRYCEDRLRKINSVLPIPWDDEGDDDALMTRMMLDTMPSNAFETFMLHQVDHLSYAEIAQRKCTVRWVVMCRMRRAVRHLAQGPERFEPWLRSGCISTER